MSAFILWKNQGRGAIAPRFPQVAPEWGPVAPSAVALKTSRPDSNILRIKPLSGPKYSRIFFVRSFTVLPVLRMPLSPPFGGGTTRVRELNLLLPPAILMFPSIPLRYIRRSTADEALPAPALRAFCTALLRRIPRVLPSSTRTSSANHPSKSANVIAPDFTRAALPCAASRAANLRTTLSTTLSRFSSPLKSALKDWMRLVVTVRPLTPSIYFYSLTVNSAPCAVSSLLSVVARSSLPCPCPSWSAPLPTNSKEPCAMLPRTPVMLIAVHIAVPDT